MKRKIPILLIFFCLFLFENCVDPYTPDIEGYGNLLIVDGLITNNKGPYQVKLARSFAFDEYFQKNVDEANVKVIDNLSNGYLFEEIASGVYQNIDTSFRGVIGNAYKLSIITEDGQEYESEFQELRSAAVIDSIYYQYKPSPDGNTKGIQVCINLHDPENNSWYYGWTYSETWEFRVPYVKLRSKGAFHVCYKSNTSNELIVGTSENNQRDQLKDHPVYYISYDNNRLRYKYSTLIQQYTISENIYKCLSELKKINEAGGSLFDETPSALRGNVYNISDEKEIVLGVFQVSGVSEKRIFIEHEDLPEKGIIPRGFEFCENVIVSIRDRSKINSLLNSGMTIMDTLYEPTRLEFVSGPACYDCRLSGTLEKPGFWE